MSKESNLYMIRDRKDYIKNLPDDDLINVLGTKGSGKTTSTLKYINDDDYIVVNCDRLYDMPTDKIVEDKFLIEIKDMLKKKYGKNAVFKGMNLLEGATALDRNRQIGGHKAWTIKIMTILSRIPPIKLPAITLKKLE